MTAETVTVERRIAARPETVFSFFTDRDRWLSWMGVDGEFTFEAGGAYRTHVNGGNHAVGRFVEIDPPKRLVFTWGWESGDMPVPPGSSTVEISLEPDGDGTLLRLVHHDLPPQARAPHGEGWNHYLDRLAVRAEGGDPGPDAWMRESGA
ncbi:SRPBCC domain-containing protein [Streptomyces sp. NPDC050704]|uniref:SRPBCC family protein n=1 Tax=Streptomyces sp. NPDC050704 TaxID=3157219 RepID=UPI00342C58AB